MSLSLALVVGCAFNSNPPPSSPTLEVFFPTLLPKTSERGVLTALALGEMVVRDGCLWLVPRRGPVYFAVWPSNYRVGSASGRTVVVETAAGGAPSPATPFR